MFKSLKRTFYLKAGARKTLLSRQTLLPGLFLHTLKPYDMIKQTDELEVSDFFFRYSLSHGFPHDRNNLRSPDVPAGLCHKAFHYPQRHNHTS